MVEQLIRNQQVVGSSPILGSRTSRLGPRWKVRMRGPEITHPGPSTSALAYWVGRLWFLLSGWQLEGEPPSVSHAVIIAAPHTSNWDLPHMLATAFVLRLRVSWMGKDSLFKPPFGVLLRLLGGVPIDRSKAGGMVQQASDQLRGPSPLMLAVPPSGTRSSRPLWKSGFYWIACTAEVPIVCGYLDYGRRCAGLGPSIVPTGDVVADMNEIRGFYNDKQGKFPEHQSTIRLRDEERSPNAEDTGPAQDEGATPGVLAREPRPVQAEVPCSDGDA